MKWHTSIGTPAVRNEKVYTTAAGAKNWCRSKLAEHKEWADRYNHKLAGEVGDVSKEIDEFNFDALVPKHHRRWDVTDKHTGLTFVVEVWTENE